MRKKLHKRINPKNKCYDKYYIVNYLEIGKDWHVIQREDDRLPIRNGTKILSLFLVSLTTALIHFIRKKLKYQLLIVLFLQQRQIQMKNTQTGTKKQMK